MAIPGLTVALWNRIWQGVQERFDHLIDRQQVLDTEGGWVIVQPYWPLDEAGNPPAPRRLAKLKDATVSPGDDALVLNLWGSGLVVGAFSDGEADAAGGISIPWFKKVDNTEAFGTGAIIEAGTTSGVAVGVTARIKGALATAVGQFSHATANMATAIGQFARASGQQSTAIGQAAWAEGLRSTALGQNATVTEDDTAELKANRARIERSNGSGKTELALRRPDGTWGVFEVTNTNGLKINGVDVGTVPGAHTHPMEDIDGLTVALADKVDTLDYSIDMTANATTHQNLQDQIDTHTHPTSEITDLDAALADRITKSNTNTQNLQGGLTLAKALTVNGALAAYGGATINGGFLNGDTNDSMPWAALVIASPTISDDFGAPQWLGDTGLDVAKINGLTAALNAKVGTVDYAIDKTANATAHQSLQDQIDALEASNGAAWGQISGTLSNQTDLQAALDARITKTGLDWTTITGTVDNHAGRITTLEDTVDDLSAGGAPHSHSNLTILNQTTAAFTTVLLSKLNGIQSGAEVNVQADWNATSGDALILNKPSTMPPSAHSHAWSEITGKPSTFTPSPHGHAWTEITGKPATFTPSSHSHPTSEVTGLDAALDDRVSKSNVNTQTMQGGLHLQKSLSANGGISAYGGLTANGGFLNGDTNDSQSWAPLRIASPTISDDFGVPQWEGDTGLDVAKINGLVAALADKVDTLDYSIDMTANATAHDNLQTAINGKADASHSHSWTQITGKPTTFAPSAHGHAWTEITGKPSTFTPSTHSHPTSQITGLDDALNAKMASSGGILNGGILNGDTEDAWPWGGLYVNSPTITDDFGPPVWSGDTGLDVSKINGLDAALAERMPVYRDTTSSTTTTSTSFVTVAGLGVPIGANEKLKLDYILPIGCDGGGGMNLAIQCPAGADMSAMLVASEGAQGSAIVTGLALSPGQVGGAIAKNAYTFSIAAGVAQLTVIVENGATAGTINLQIRSVTTGQTSAVAANDARLIATKAE